MNPLDQYTYRREIYRNVFKCQNSRKAPVVIKKIKSSKLNHLEYTLPFDLKSDFIFRINSVHFHNDFSFLQMKYMKMGDLHNNISCSLEAFVQIIIDILEALRVVHEHGYIHNDVKPENILITNNYRGMLTDFGLCRKYTGDNREFLGTIKYMAPEKINKVPYNQTVDIWAIGVTIFKHFTRQYPFSVNVDNLATFKNWQPDLHKIKDNPYIKYICFKVFEYNHKDRMKIEEIQKLLIDYKSLLIKPNHVS